MRINAGFVVLFAIGSMLSCSQEKLDTPVEDDWVEPGYEDAAAYLQLQPGNYWVYESYSVNLETGAVTPLHKRDSIYVLKDTLIGRSDYFILEGSRLGQEYRTVLRCSGPEAMDPEGHLLFSTALTGDTIDLPDGLLPEGAQSGDVCIKLAEGIEVPYGTFDALEYRRTFYLASSEDIKTGGNSRHQSDFYAKGIGLIQYTSFFHDQPLDIEMRLVRCNVQ